MNRRIATGLLLFFLALPAQAAEKETLASLQQKAADGDFAAQNALGLRYLNGDGVARNAPEGYFWGCLAERCSALKYACAEAVRKLSLEDHAALDGRIRAWLPAKTVELMARAQEGGLKEQFRLGMLYRDGGDCASPFEKDAAEAWFWLGLVVARQDAGRSRDDTAMIEEAARLRDETAPLLDKKTRAAVQRRVQAWKAE